MEPLPSWEKKRNAHVYLCILQRVDRIELNEKSETCKNRKHFGKSSGMSFARVIQSKLLFSSFIYRNTIIAV